LPHLNVTAYPLPTALGRELLALVSS